MIVHLLFCYMETSKPLCNWVFVLIWGERERWDTNLGLRSVAVLSWFGSRSHCTKWGFNLICLDKNILVNLFHWIQVLVVLNSIFYCCQLFWFYILLVWFIPHSKNIPTSRWTFENTLSLVFVSDKVSTREQKHRIMLRPSNSLNKIFDNKICFSVVCLVDFSV